MKTVLLAFRNLNRQKKRTFLLGGAIAFGVLIVTLINSFTASFVENVGENFSHLLAGHIFIEGVEKDAEGDQRTIIRDDTPIREALDEEDLTIRYVTRRSEARGTLIFGGQTVSQNIVGADWSEESFFKDRLILLEGSFDTMLEDPRSIILSQKVASKLNVALQERITVRLRTTSGQQNVGEFTLAAISYDPSLFAPISAYANLSYVNELLDIAPHEYETLGIFLESMTLIDEEADRLYSSLSEKAEVFDRDADEGDRNPVMAMMRRADEDTWEGSRFRLYTLNDVLQEVEQIVMVLNRAGLVIFLILFLIIMVGITNTFRMIMIERTREIGTIRALGMQRNGVRTLFLLEALFLALGGALLGLLLAGLAMAILSSIFWGYQSPIFILLKNGYMTFRLRFAQIAQNLGAVSVLTMLAAFLPARKAAKMPPVDALRA